MTGPSDPHSPLVVLIGPPGAGKTTIGRKLAREMGVDLYDTDAGIEDTTGRGIPEIFAADGEPGFRRIEEEVVARALHTERGVVSLGGGAVLSANTRALLRDRTVVYLEISIDEGLRRTGAVTTRPLLDGADAGAKYRELMRIRRPLYREVATVRVRTDGRSPGRVVHAIVEKLSLDPSPAATTTNTTPATTARRSSRTRARRRARARQRAALAQRDDTTQECVGTAAADDTTDPAPGTRPEPRSAETLDASSGTTGSGPPEDEPRTPGRSRRARARRARARRRLQEQAENTQTETEQPR